MDVATVSAGVVGQSGTDPEDLSAVLFGEHRVARGIAYRTPPHS